MVFRRPAKKSPAEILQVTLSGQKRGFTLTTVSQAITNRVEDSHDDAALSERKKPHRAEAAMELLCVD
jgi:hypothetical protein